MKQVVDALTDSGWTLSSGSVGSGMCMVSKTIGEANVMMTLKTDGDDVRLHRLRATPEFKGGGKQALTELCSAADAQETVLLLTVQPFGSSVMSEDKLARLYKGFGFEPDPYSADYAGMIRYAETPTFRI